MSTIRMLLFLFTAGTMSAVHAAQPTNGLLVLGSGGDYAHGSFKGKGAWLGLYCSDLNCSLRKADVTITRTTKKNILEEEEPVDTMSVPDDPIAVVRGVTSLSVGPVKTWYRSEEPQNDSSLSGLKTLGLWKMPWGKKPLTLSAIKASDYQLDYFVSDGKVSQKLLTTSIEGHYGGDTSIPEIHWIGDLDQDNIIDIILSLPDDNCGFDMRLYLSATATSKEVLNPAAALAGTEPACGC